MISDIRYPSRYVVSSQYNIILQPDTEDPRSIQDINKLKTDAQNLANRESKPIVYLFHDGTRFEFQPNSKRQ